MMKHFFISKNVMNIVVNKIVACIYIVYKIINSYGHELSHQMTQLLQSDQLV